MSQSKGESGKSAPYPGIPTTADGSETVVWVETNITQSACAYPITSSSKMGEGYNLAVSNGTKNLWDETLIFLEPESEHSAATACEGFAVAGGRTTTFTSGQGLVLMKEVLYTISGKGLPIVFHIGARALTSQSLNVHAGHDDVMAVADCGWGMVFGMNGQASGDLAAITRRAAEDCGRPFMNVQDGFLTTHTVESVLLAEKELLEEFVGSPSDRLTSLFDPYNPIMTGTVQNQDSYMKGKIAQRAYYDQMMPALKSAMADWGELTGREYSVVEPYRMEDAEYALVGMGGMMETAMATADYLRDEQGKKVGVVHISSFRPFPGPEVVVALKDVKAFAVIERMDNPIAQSNPLTAEIKSSFADALTGHEGYPAIDSIPVIYSGSAGLGSRDVRPGDFIGTCAHMWNSGEPRYFVLGIKHDLAIEAPFDPDIRPAGSFSMRGHVMDAGLSRTSAMRRAMPPVSMPPPPHISPSPWRACMSPTCRSAPGTFTPRWTVAPGPISWISKLPPHSPAHELVRRSLAGATPSVPSIGSTGNETPASRSQMIRPRSISTILCCGPMLLSPSHPGIAPVLPRYLV